MSNVILESVPKKPLLFYKASTLYSDVLYKFSPCNKKIISRNFFVFKVISSQLQS